MIGSLGSNLRILRYKVNKQQAIVAKEIGISSRTLSRYELDKANPNEETLKKFANYYGVTVQQLTEEDI